MAQSLALSPVTGVPARTWRWDELRSRCLRETGQILRRREDAEEAAQDALLRAWRQRHQCQALGDPEPWVAQIARNEALRTLDKRRRREDRSGGSHESAMAEGLPIVHRSYALATERSFSSRSRDWVPDVDITEP